MPTSVVIKNDDFRLISEFAQPDAKKRLSLGEALSGVTAYNIYRNTLGQLILGGCTSCAAAAKPARKAGRPAPGPDSKNRSEEHTSELQSLRHLVCRLLLE